jgi:hypothetical protein
MQAGERISWVCLLSVLGCGGSQSNLPPAAAASDERSVGSEVASEAEPATQPAPIEQRGPRSSTGQGRFTVRALVDNKPVAARVRVLDSNIEGESGTELSIGAGTHRVEVRVTDTAALADLPVQVQQVFIESGKDTQFDAVFPWSKVTLNVVAGGRSRNGAPVRLLRNGAVVAELRSGGQAAYVSPGKYEADVLLNGGKIRVHGLQFLEGATQNVPVRVQF